MSELPPPHPLSRPTIILVRSLYLPGLCLSFPLYNYSPNVSVAPRLCVQQSSRSWEHFQLSGLFQKCTETVPRIQIHLDCSRTDENVRTLPDASGSPVCSRTGENISTVLEVPKWLSTKCSRSVEIVISGQFQKCLDCSVEDIPAPTCPDPTRPDPLPSKRKSREQKESFGTMVIIDRSRFQFPDQPTQSLFFFFVLVFYVLLLYLAFIILYPIQL